MLNQICHQLGTAPSLIRELFAYGLQQAAIVGAENVYDYSLGNPSIPAPAAVNQAICDILSDTDSIKVHGYSMAAGFEGTRTAIAENLNRRFGTNYKASNLFLTCGAAPALLSVIKALTVNSDSEIMAIAPFFPEYRPYAESNGAKLVVVPADTEAFQINMTALESLISPNTQGIIINSPNNPSGVVYSRQTLQTLAQLLSERAKEYGHPIYIIADEPYRELVYGGVTAPFIPNLYPDTVVCYSYSKSLSLPGERIGYIYVPKQAADHERLLAAIAGASRAAGHVCAPSLWQKVIARCAGLRPDLQAYDRNRKALYEGLLACGYEIAKPDGAFYLFIKAPGGDAVAFSEKAKQKDLLLVPGDGFGCPGWFRVCYCVNYDTIVKSLPVFKALAED